MIIKLSPIAATETTSAPVIALAGMLLTIDSQVVDLSAIPEGGQAEASENSPLLGIVTRDEVTVRYPYSTDLYESSQSTNPVDYEFEITDGTVPCPLIKRNIENV